MRIEEIAIRQEVRQMLNEAGINKNTLKDMVKEVLQEEIAKACKQALNESDVDGAIFNVHCTSFLIGIISAILFYMLIMAQAWQYLI